MLLTLPATFRNLLSQLQSIVFMVYLDDDDHHYYFQFCEGRDAEALGIQTKNITNVPLHHIFDAESSKQFRHHFDYLMHYGGDTAFEIAFQDHWLMVNASRTTEDHGAEGHILGSMMDISILKHAEKELRLALDHEKQLSALKTRFLNTVSHEFRTPLSGIGLAAELLDRHVQRMDDDTRTHTLQQIHKRVRELRSLMDSLLQQSASEALSELYHPIPEDINQVCTDIIQDFRATVEHSAQNIHLCINSPLPMVMCDKRLLRHALRNLLTNALKYSPPESDVIVCTGYQASYVFVSVQDFGMGISPEEQEHIFKPFFRSKGVERVSGTGLGLSIAQDFIRLHHGRIELHSELGKGSLFTILLPAVEFSAYLPDHKAIHHDITNIQYAHCTKLT